MGNNHPDREILKNKYFFLNLCPPLLTFCGNLVGPGRFISDHHGRPSQHTYSAVVVLVDFLFLMTSLALLEVMLVPADFLVLVHVFGNANGTECDILLT